MLLTVGGMNLCPVQATSVSHVGQTPRIHCSCSIQGIQLFTGWKHNFDYLTIDKIQNILISGHGLLLTSHGRKCFVDACLILTRKLRKYVGESSTVHLLRS